MGNAYEKKEEYDNAIEAYQKAIEINPKYDKAYNNMGNAYYSLGQFNESIKALSMALHINPNNSLAYSNLFELQLTQNQPFDQALEKKYIELFQNKKESFIEYEMLKILQNISHKKEVNVEQWKQKYEGVSMGGWSFDELDEWIGEVEDTVLKARLQEALEVFKHPTLTQYLKI
jgi:tetratricopeptide (TPR) repeat protein